MYEIKAINIGKVENVIKITNFQKLRIKCFYFQMRDRIVNREKWRDQIFSCLTFHALKFNCLNSRQNRVNLNLNPNSRQSTHISK